MTEAFRRDPRMVSFAIHLGIDAFPSGWMKTIVDCERKPKKAFFAFRDALSPVLPSLRAPRRFWWCDETFEAELFIANDRAEPLDEAKFCAEFKCGDFVCATLRKQLTVVAAADSQGMGRVSFALPEIEDRAACSVCIQVLDAGGLLLGQSHFEFDVFARRGELPKWSIPSELTEAMVERAKAGETVLCGPLAPGSYEVAGETFEIAPIGMGELTFCSRATGHLLVEGFQPNDFRLWYDDAVGYSSTFADSVIVGGGWEPILLAGRGGFGEAWVPTPVVAEKRVGKGRLIICQLKLEGRIALNPPAAIFADRLRESVNPTS